jgi:hypothetical protein
MIFKSFLNYHGGKNIYILAVETRGILNRIKGLSGRTDEFRLLIEELGDCRVTGSLKGTQSINIKR